MPSFSILWNKVQGPLIENQRFVIPIVFLFFIWFIPFFNFVFDLIIKIIFGVLLLCVVLIIGLIPTAIKTVPSLTSLDEVLKQTINLSSNWYSQSTQPHVTPSSPGIFNNLKNWTTSYLTKKGINLIFQSKLNVIGTLHCGLFRLAFAEFDSNRFVILGIFNGWFPLPIDIN